jgi:hypothetical protein
MDALGPAPAGRTSLRENRKFGAAESQRRSMGLGSTNQVERRQEGPPARYPLVYRHARNHAAKLIQRAWSRYMTRVVYKYLFDCSKEFEQTLTPVDLSRIYPEFLESSDPRLTAKLRIRMQGESFPPCLVCRIVAELAPSVDGGKHAPKWIPLYNAGKIVPVDRKALVHMFIEAMHVLKESETSGAATQQRPPKS